MYEPFLFLMSLNGSYILGQSVSNVTTIPGSWFPRQCRRWECEKTAKQCVYGKVWTCFQSRHSGCVCYHTSLVTEKTDKELRPRVCVILPRGCVILPRSCLGGVLSCLGGVLSCVLYGRKLFRVAWSVQCTPYFTTQRVSQILAFAQNTFCTRKTRLGWFLLVYT